MEESRDDHGEKKSVMKKVKDKAKKMKETLTKHDHNGTHNSDPDLNEDDDTAEGDNPEIHGAPVYESTVIRSTDLPMQLPNPEENPKTTLNIRKPVLQRETPPQLHDPAPVSGFQEPGTRVPSNYEAKDVDPTTQQGGGEEDVTPLAQRVRNLNIEEGKRRWDTDTGSHDQFSPEPIATKEEPKISYPRATSEGGVSDKDSVPHHETTQFKNPVSAIEDPSALGTRVPSNYETKSVDPTEQGGEEAEVNPFAQRLDNLKVEEDKHDREMEPGSYEGNRHDQLSPEQKTSEPRDDSTVGRVSDESPNTPLLQSYGYKVAEKLAPVYEKFVGSRSAGTDKASSEGNANSPTGGVAASVKEYFAEKLRPGDEDKAFSDSIAETLRKKKEQSPQLSEVTKSPEVAARLGTPKEGELEGSDAVAAGKESSGSGFVGRLKDTAIQWLGKTNPTDTAQEAVNKSYVSGGGDTAD